MRCHRLAACLLLLSPLPLQAGGDTLPETLSWTLETVSGDQVEVPGRERRLLVLAFARDHQAALDSWLPFCQAPPGGIACLQVPLVETDSRVLRWAIRRGMENGFSDQQKRQTAPWFGELNTWQQAFGLADEEPDIRWFLLEGRTILGSGRGAADVTAETQLRAWLGATAPAGSGSADPGGDTR